MDILSRLVRCLPAIFVLLAPTPSRAETASGANAWTYGTLSYRREVTLPADTSSRSNVPIWVDLRALGNVDLASVKVEEITGSSPAAVSAAAYAQPYTGREPRAFWVASGSTAAGASRRFLMYYNKLSTAASYTFNYSRSGSTFGTYKLTADGNRYYHTLTGDKADFMRGARKVDGVGDAQHAAFYEQGSDFFRFKNPSDSFSPFNGIRMSYAFMGAAFTEALFFNVSGAERYYDAIKTDRNGPTAAFCAHYTISDQVAHQTEVTHRVFQGQPILEFSITTTPKSGSLLDWDNSIFNSRQFYWDTDTFTGTRMVTDLGYDGTPDSNGHCCHYLILGNSDGKACGLFTFKAGQKRRQTSTHSIQDFYATAADQGSTMIYYAVGGTNDLKTLFATMKRGYPVGIEQQPSFTVMQPAEGQHFIKDEALTAVVAGPALGSDASLKVTFPNGSTQTFAPVSNTGHCATFNLGTLSGNYGTWTLTAVSGGVTRTRKVDTLNPSHPRVLFRQSDLDRLRARWKTDSRYRDHIQLQLNAAADAEVARSAVPATLSGEPRNYGRRMMSVAAALLMDPDNTQYRTRMWADFKTMMAWQQWDPIGNGIASFSCDDVERGEVLHQLVLVYDWFYSDLTVAERRSYAEMLALYADSLIACDYAQLLYPRYNTYNYINNSRAIGQCAAIAAIDRAVSSELPEDRHTPWKTRLDAYWPNLLVTLSSDGAYNAGQSYHALLLWALQVWSETRRLNTGDTSLYQSSWFRNMPAYVLYGMMPGRVGNFGGLMPFGNTERAPYYSLQADLALAGQFDSAVAEWIADNLDYTRVEPPQPVWQEYSRQTRDPATMPNWHLFDKKGIFVYRSDWTPQALYFAGKCGDYWGGHEHPDAGTFVIHRNGFPYIAAPLYLEAIGTEDENILVSNGMLPRGRTDGNYSDGVDSQYWGKTLQSLGSPNYFNVLQDPCAAYEDGSNLTFYNREFVGFSDVVVLRDVMQASVATTFKLMLHACQTDPQTDPAVPYDLDQYPAVQVFKQTSQANRIRLYPNQAAAPDESMAIYNLSRTGWTTGIGTWKLTTKYIPETLADGAERRSNSSDTVYARGGQLTRQVQSVSAASCLQVMSFRNDDYNVRAWSSTLADDGMVLYDGAASNACLKVVWPKGGAMANVSGAEGLTVTGAMAMRNYENKEFGGRDLKLLRDDSAQGEGSVLVSSNVPLTMVSRTAGGIGEAWICCSSAATVTLYCSKMVRSVKFDSAVLAWKSNGALCTFTIPAAPTGGRLELDLHSNAARPDWSGYE